MRWPCNHWTSLCTTMTMSTRLGLQKNNWKSDSHCHGATESKSETNSTDGRKCLHRNGGFQSQFQYQNRPILSTVFYPIVSTKKGNHAFYSATHIFNAKFCPCYATGSVWPDVEGCHHLTSVSWLTWENETLGVTTSKSEGIGMKRENSPMDSRLLKYIRDTQPKLCA